MVYTPLGNALLRIVVHTIMRAMLTRCVWQLVGSGGDRREFGSHNRAEIVCGSVEKNISVHFAVSAVTTSIADADLLM